MCSLVVWYHEFVMILVLEVKLSSSFGINLLSFTRLSLLLEKERHTNVYVWGALEVEGETRREGGVSINGLRNNSKNVFGTTTSAATTTARGVVWCAVVSYIYPSIPSCADDISSSTIY